MKVAAVVVAAGKGERLGSPKQFLLLGGIPLLLWSVRAMVEHPSIGEVVVVLPAGMVESPPGWLVGVGVRCCAGGGTRRESVGRGVDAVSADSDLVLIHDAARPFVTAAVIERVLAAAADEGAALPVLPVVDTIKRLESGTVLETVDRSRLARAQTPQGFRARMIREVHAWAERTSRAASDDAALCEMQGYRVVAVEGDPHNVKITTAEDLALAEWLIDSGRVQPPAERNGPIGSV